jgi:hypothetical protein
MKFRPTCWYYGKFIPAYVEGVLQSWRPAMCRRLQRHIARCASCRSAVVELAATHTQLRDWARKARADDARSTPPRQSWRRRSMADRVGFQITAIESRARRQNLNTKLWLVTACLAALLVIVTEPTPAREWIFRRLFAPPVLVNVTPTPKPTVELQPAPDHDPFAPQISLDNSPDVTPDSDAAAPASADNAAPPPPPLLPESATSPTAPTRSVFAAGPTDHPALQILDQSNSTSYSSPNAGSHSGVQPGGAAGKTAKNAVHIRDRARDAAALATQ